MKVAAIDRPVAGRGNDQPDARSADEEVGLPDDLACAQGGDALGRVLPDCPGRDAERSETSMSSRPARYRSESTWRCRVGSSASAGSSCARRVLMLPGTGRVVWYSSRDMVESASSDWSPNAVSSLAGRTFEAAGLDDSGQHFLRHWP